jgi:hypothetical protein
MKTTFKTLSFAICLCCFSSMALALTNPATGSFGYEIYDFIANSIVAGAIGVAIGIAILAYAVYHILRSNVFGAIACAVALLILVKINDIAISMGINL